MPNDANDKNQSPNTTGHEGRMSTLKMRRRRVKKQSSIFSIERTTEEISVEAASRPVEDSGPYAEIREQLDYDYHSHYNTDRRWLQDTIVGSILGNLDCDATTPTQPWFVFVVGAVGSGKNDAIEELVKSNRLPLLSFVEVDIDNIKRKLPEFGTYVEKRPESADAMTRKEAGYIGEISERAAMRAGKNVIYKCCPIEIDWYTKDIARIRKEHPAYMIGIIHVTGPENTIISRGVEEVTKIGLRISEEEIRYLVENIPKTVEQLKPKTDYFCVLYNGPEDLELVGDEDWDLFQVNWFQAPRMKEDEKEDVTSRASIRASIVAFKVAPPCTRKSQRRFSCYASSEDNHASQTAELQFSEPYADVRSTLDYTYHSNYHLERQALQDRIITESLEGTLIRDIDGNVTGTVPTEPFIVFTAGAMGAGKGYTINRLVEEGKFPLEAFIKVDPDEIRRHFPEYHIYVDQNPELAGELTRKEAGFVAEILTTVALKQGKNVMVDGSLRDSDWYGEYFNSLRKDYPILKLAIIHVTAPRELVLKRASSRVAYTGRVVPRKTLLMALEQVPRSVKILKPLVDYYVDLNNPEGDIEILTDGHTWESFESQWRQLPKNSSDQVITRVSWDQQMVIEAYKNCRNKRSTLYKSTEDDMLSGSDSNNSDENEDNL
eukprot:CAMPEP_0194340702 /NCGR_PEP_ID=MMETSP0171-20130528/87315_1 /TAXON_ID=218684 /ORGANISM="Corethron pennatum, Strain L29A3" /LENGTH=660 /DNA_ID=CAMNT_0039105765 /DNA_START=32 /DNA_END=2014 /DNA_ORIENTATION=+